MKDYLTKRQIEFLRYAKENQTISSIDIKKFYTTQPLEQLKRLIELGYLKEDIVLGKYIFTGKEFE